ncbi:uncharacterized protein LOC128245401 [Mya arenaria]|uniref:uncharacterized protein LOC128245401 n=1 Tax=Mya arenaria TaxID=6604 RepID=UPI0022E6A204|nr:uncharacterized protein LOC128245401 [Mya arenaria]
MDSFSLLFSFLLYAGSVKTSENENATNLQCYACFATGGDNECEQFKTYKKAMDGIKSYSHYLKNCTPPYNQSCIIETFSANGLTVSHIRDCSNGEFFSFNSAEEKKKPAYTRLYDLTNNNETACVWDGEKQVCLSKCDSDFCNGPVFDSAPDGQSVSLTVMSIVGLHLLLLILCWNDGAKFE